MIKRGSGVLAAMLLLLLLAGPALAEPFLVSDPQTDATAYRIRLSTNNGQTWGSWTQGPPVSNAMRFDLAPVPPGDYDGQAEAGAVISVTDSTTGQVTTSQLWSSPAPFELNVPTIRTPARVAIQAPGTPGSGN